MVGKVDYSSVPTTVDLENNSNQKKYTINRGSGKGLVISKPLCVLMAIGALLLAVLVGLVVFFLVPRCSEAVPEALTKVGDLSNVEVEERLPRSIAPINYRLQLIPNFENSTTSGAVTIHLRALEETNQIIFHLNEIEIDKHSVTLKSLSKTPMHINEQNNLEGQRYQIILSDSLKKGQEYLLDINFKGLLNKHLQGFYKGQYEDIRTRTTRTTASTQFSPTDARRAFPCFDEPSFKATFTISMARPANMSSVSNMPLKKTDIFVDKPDWFWDHYEETPKMSTYLVAFVVSDLVPTQSKDPMIKIWTRNSLKPQSEYAADIAPKILHFFEDYFQMKFPLPKIDIVALPEFGFSAMENWGLITFRESTLLFDNFTSTVLDQRSIAKIISHEIGHQWFGNLVTPKWWNDLWLKEGFATYLQYLGVNFTEPSWHIVDEFLPSETARAFAIDALESSRPISFEVKNSKQIRQAFDEISYSKGACIIRMMNHFLGEETFKKGLITFLKKYQLGNADRQELFQSLTEEAHKDFTLNKNETVKHIMDTWTEQAGFPVVTALADRENHKLKITQKRFLYTNGEDDNLWWVPVSLTTALKPDFTSTKPQLWLRKVQETTIDLNISDSWYLLNLNQSYYIVNYDEPNWRLIIEKIMDFPTLIRAQLIGDSMELARANMLDYDIPFRIIARMAVRDQQVMFVPTSVAFNKLKFLSDILASTPAFGLFEEYHKSIFKLTYQLVGFEDDVPDYRTRRIRLAVLTWSCRSSDSLCAHESRSRFRQWMTHGTRLEPNLKEIIYCTAIREGNEAEWNHAYSAYENTQSPSEKNMLLDALGCTRLKWLLSRYLEILIEKNSSIRIQDADRVFESVARNKFGTAIAFDFLRKNWNGLQEHYGEGFNILARMVKSLAHHMNTEYQLAELERFRDSIKNNISTTAQAFDSAIETVRSNVEWMKKNYDSVENWLKKYKHHYIYL